MEEYRVEQEPNQHIGGKIIEIASETLKNPDYLKQFDEATQNTINTYIESKGNPKLITMEDFDKFLAQNEKLNDRGMVDVVVNFVEQDLYEAVKWEKLTETPQEVKEQIINELNNNIDIVSNFHHYSAKTDENVEKSQKKEEFNVLDYLKKQLKYLGFGEGEELHKDLENAVSSAEGKFSIQTNSDRASEGNQANFTINFNKSEKGGVFLNSFNTQLITADGEERTHSFSANKFTMKESINLLEGRAVKTELQNSKTKEFEPVFVKLKLNEPKNEQDNYQMNFYRKNYGIDTAKIVEKSNLIFQKPEWRDITIKALEKGNIVPVKFLLDNKEVQGKAVLNPQYKTLNLYDNEMNRVNTNKPLQGLEQDNSHEKTNVRQQNLSRGI